MSTDRGRDEEHLGVAPSAPVPNLLDEHPGTHRLIGHDQYPPWPAPATGPRRLRLRRSRQPPEATDAKSDQTCGEHNPEARSGGKRDHDHCSCAAADDHDKPERFGL